VTESAAELRRYTINTAFPAGKVIGLIDRSWNAGWLAASLAARSPSPTRRSVLPQPATGWP